MDLWIARNMKEKCKVENNKNLDQIVEECLVEVTQEENQEQKYNKVLKEALNKMKNSKPREHTKKRLLSEDEILLKYSRNIYEILCQMKEESFKIKSLKIASWVGIGILFGMMDHIWINFIGDIGAGLKNLFIWLKG